MTIQVELLKSIPHFAELSPVELDSIRKLMFEKTAEKGEVILLDGDPAKTLYFVASGAVKVFKTSSEGKEQLLSIVLPGDSLNDVPIFDEGLNLGNAQAMSPVVLYGVSKSALEAILRHHPQVALNIIEVLAKRVRHFVTIVEDLSFRPVIGRVAKILLEHAGDGKGTSPRLTQQEMAAIAGTVREVVGRSLKSLEEEGVIRLDRHRILITDREALREMVGASS